MAYMTHKKIKGITYYYAEECGRINGKVKRLWQKYLGNIEKIIAAIESPIKKPKYAEIFHLGNPAACLNTVEIFNMIRIIDSVLPKRSQGLSIGFYLILAAVNRCIEATSKHSMWKWFKNTILLRAFPHVTKESLSSQRFWDNLAKIKQSQLHCAWMKLVHSIVERENIDLSTTSFDGTNFYTFLSTFNTHCSLAKNGKNKQGRSNLRQVNYALFCTRKEHFPLYFDVFEGNKNDTKIFGDIIERFFEEFKHIKPDRKGMTIVFDKGNNSKKNIQKFVNNSGFHFVCSVKLGEHKELAEISNNDECFTDMDEPQLENIKAFRTKKKIYGKKFTTVVTFNDKLYRAQIRTINTDISKCLVKLSALSTKLMDRYTGKITKGKPPTFASVEKQVASILKRQFMKNIIKKNIKQYGNIPLLSYWQDSKKYAKIADTYLGKKIIITDNHTWSTKEIIRTYHSQYIIEHAFRKMKDRKSGSWWPMFLWTDNMIRVHGFYCSLSLLIWALINKKVKEAKIEISSTALYEKLKRIKEVLNVYPKQGKKQYNQSVVSNMDETQLKIFDIFNMNNYLSS